MREKSINKRGIPAETKPGHKLHGSRKREDMTGICCRPTTMWKGSWTGPSFMEGMEPDGWEVGSGRGRVTRAGAWPRAIESNTHWSRPLNLELNLAWKLCVLLLMDGGSGCLSPVVQLYGQALGSHFSLSLVRLGNCQVYKMELITNTQPHSHREGRGRIRYLDFVCQKRKEDFAKEDK